LIENVIICEEYESQKQATITLNLVWNLFCIIQLPLASANGKEKIQKGL
jgi:hypothetical protein